MTTLHKAIVKNSLQVGDTPNDPSAITQAHSTTQGAIPAPKMTTAQRDAISSPTEGLQVEDTELNQLMRYNGTGWEAVVVGQDSIVLYGEIQDDPTGFENQTDSNISFEITGPPAREFTIAPAVTDFSYYIKGVKYTKSAAETVAITDTEGLWYIYYDGATLTTTQSFDIAIITDHAFVAAVYWDATNSLYRLYDERHGHKMPSSVHTWLHSYEHSKYDSGALPTVTDINGLGDDDSSARISITVGGITDEDISHTITAINDTAPKQIYYFDASGNVRWTTQDDGGGDYFPCLTFPTGTRLAYNPPGSGLLEVAHTNFVLVHTVALNNGEYGWFVGQAEYGSLSAAREGIQAEGAALNFGQLSSLTPEFVLISSYIYQCRDNYNNTVSARIRTLDSGEDFYDWRAANISGAPAQGPIPLLDATILVGNASNVATGVTMSGDATIIADGTMTIAANVVSNGKLAQMATNTVKVNATNDTANADDLTLGTNTLLARSAGDIVALSVGTATLVGRTTAGNLAALGQSDILDVAGLTIANNEMLVGSGTNIYSKFATTSYGRDLLNQADDAALHATINLEIGSGGTGDVQAYSERLDELAASAGTINKMIYTDTDDSYATTDFTALGKALVGGADAAAGRLTLELNNVTNVATENVAYGPTWATRPQSTTKDSLYNKFVLVDAAAAANAAAIATVVAGSRVKAVVDTSSVNDGNITLSGEQTIGGLLTSTSRVLLVDQDDGEDNGIYVTATGAWARATDYDGTPDGEVGNGDIIPVVNAGSDQDGHHFLLTTQNPIDLGTTVLTYTETVGATEATSQEITDGTNAAKHVTPAGLRGSTLTTSGLRATSIQVGTLGAEVDVAVSTQNMIAGFGLTGGGTLASDRTFNVAVGDNPGIAVNADDIRLAIDKLVETAIVGADHIAFWDADGSDNKKVTFTNFESTLSHDNLNGFVADEHVAHTGVDLTAGSGLSGGGDISASRTFDLDINSLTTEVTVADGDFLPFWDITATADNKKITWANLQSAISIGIDQVTGTRAQFDVALTDATFLYTGDLDHNDLQGIDGAVLSTATGSDVQSTALAPYFSTVGVQATNKIDFSDSPTWMAREWHTFTTPFRIEVTGNSFGGGGGQGKIPIGTYTVNDVTAGGILTTDENDFTTGSLSDGSTSIGALMTAHGEPYHLTEAEYSTIKERAGAGLTKANSRIDMDPTLNEHLEMVIDDYKSVDDDGTDQIVILPKLGRTYMIYWRYLIYNHGITDNAVDMALHNIDAGDLDSGSAIPILVSANKKIILSDGQNVSFIEGHWIHTATANNEQLKMGFQKWESGAVRVISGNGTVANTGSSFIGAFPLPTSD